MTINELAALKAGTTLYHVKSGKEYRTYRDGTFGFRVWASLPGGKCVMTDRVDSPDVANVGVVGQRNGKDFGPMRQIFGKDAAKWSLTPPTTKPE